MPPSRSGKERYEDDSMIARMALSSDFERVRCTQR